jgi:hypothetical protein
MAFCSYCAAALDPALAMCAQCGRVSEPLPVAAAPSQARPFSVTQAGVLLLAAFVISVLSFGRLLTTPSIISRLGPVYWIRTIGFWIAWIVALSFFWQRQNWARIAIALLVVWHVGNLGWILMRNLGLGTVSFSFAIALLIAVARLAALVLMFTPDSNAWFKK